jgi:hypothetical protein
MRSERKAHDAVRYVAPEPPDWLGGPGFGGMAAAQQGAPGPARLPGRRSGAARAAAAHFFCLRFSSAAFWST